MLDTREAEHQQGLIHLAAVVKYELTSRRVERIYGKSTPNKTVDIWQLIVF